MKILLTGGTGFIGKALSKKLTEKGHSLVILSRDASSVPHKLNVPCQAYSWNATREPAPIDAFDGVDALIHLAGEPIAAARWTDAIKKRIHDSRAMGTANLVATLNRLDRKPQTFISASAVGFYGTRGDQTLTEETGPGRGFLAKVCEDWESEARKAQGIRTVIVRTGIVLGEDGGALEKMLPPFKAGLGGPLGDGKHWMSWIHLEDLVNLYVFILDHAEVNGTVNAVAPEPITNADFSHALGHALHRPSLVKVPHFALKLLFGEMADEALLASARALPKVATQAGFTFQHTEMNETLRSVI